jgi:hypothetical protein
MDRREVFPVLLPAGPGLTSSSFPSSYFSIIFVLHGRWRKRVSRLLRMFSHKVILMKKHIQYHFFSLYLRRRQFEEF